MSSTLKTVVTVLVALVIIWILAFVAQRAIAETRTSPVHFTPDHSKVYGCGTGAVIVTEYGPLGDLFKTKWSQYFCFRGGEVYGVRPLKTKSWTTGLGEATNWSETDSGGDRVGFYEPGRHAHKSSARVHWHNCTPIPTGCLHNEDVWWNGVFEVHSDGSIKFWRK